MLVRGAIGKMVSSFLLGTGPSLPVFGRHG